jgi:chaperonin cofactor prefoldin
VPAVDIKMRHWEALRALQSLELQIEQYRLHIKELSAHPNEAARAQAELKKLLDGHAVQRTYCDLLAQEQEAVTRKNGLHAA